MIAPAATGSITQGLRAAFAAATASRIAAACGEDMVPRLTTSASAIAANSATSSVLSTIAGEAPSASSAFAVVLVTTALVMLWTSGTRARIAASVRATAAAVAIPSVIVRP